MRVQPYGKYVSVIRSADQSILCYAKYVDRNDGGGAAEVTLATIQQGANNLTFVIAPATEAVMGTYTGASGAANQIVFADANIASIQNLVDTINGYGAGMVAAGTTFNRWRASRGDYRPGYVIGAGDANVVAAQNALVGVDHVGYAVTADISGHAVANTIGLCIGGPTTQRGTWQPKPDHFESDYTSTTAGVVTRRRWSHVRRQEEQHGVVRHQVFITDIFVGPLFANNDIDIVIYDNQDNIIWTYLLGVGGNPVPAQALNKDLPIEGPVGSELYVEVAGTGAFTDGNVRVEGRVLVA